MNLLFFLFRLSQSQVALKAAMDELMHESSRIQDIEKASQAKDSAILNLQSELATTTASLSQLESDLTAKFESKLRQCQSRQQEGGVELKAQLEAARSRCAALEGQIALMKGTFEAEKDASAIALESLKSKLSSEAEKRVKETEAAFQVR